MMHGQHTEQMRKVLFASDLACRNVFLESLMCAAEHWRQDRPLSSSQMLQGCTVASSGPVL